MAVVEFHPTYSHHEVDVGRVVGGVKVGFESEGAGSSEVVGVNLGWSGAEDGGGGDKVKTGGTSSPNKIDR